MHAPDDDELAARGLALLPRPRRRRAHPRVRAYTQTLHTAMRTEEAASSRVVGGAAPAPAADPHAYPKHLRLPLTIAYCAIVALNVAFCMGLRGPALLRVAEQIGLVRLDGSTADDVDLSQLTEMGLANMMFTGTSAVFSVFITGAIVDRMPRFHWLTFGMCQLLAFLSLSIIWIDAAWQLVFISALMGMCLSAIMPLLAALMWVYKEDVAPSMHAFNASFGIGMPTPTLAAP